MILCQHADSSPGVLCHFTNHCQAGTVPGRRIGGDAGPVIGTASASGTQAAGCARLTPYRGTAASLWNMAGLTIGKFAAAEGVGVETVRFYQRRGLLALLRCRLRRLVQVCEHGD